MLAIIDILKIIASDKINYLMDIIELFSFFYNIFFIDSVMKIDINFFGNTAEFFSLESFVVILEKNVGNHIAFDHANAGIGADCTV